MKIGVSIKPIIQIAEDPQEIFETIFVEGVGFDYVEAHTDNLDDFEIFILKLIENLGIKFSLHCPHMYSSVKVNFCSANKKDIKNADHWLKKSIEYAKKLKAKNIIIHPDLPKNCSKKKALNILEKHIKNNINNLRNNQRILIENMPGKDYALSTPKEFKNFLKRFKKQVFVCWDIGHEIGRFRKQEFYFPKILKNKIKEVHISGVVNYGDHHPLTKGNLKLKECIESLKKIKYKDAIIFEIVTNNPLDIIESKEILDKFV